MNKSLSENIVENFFALRTCIACPEQYDVINIKNDKAVGYIRMRHGRLVCNPYDKNNEEPLYDIKLYEKIYDDEFLGNIPDEEAIQEINNCYEALEKYYNE